MALDIPGLIHDQTKPVAKWDSVFQSRLPMPWTQVSYYDGPGALCAHYLVTGGEILW